MAIMQPCRHCGRRIQLQYADRAYRFVRHQYKGQLCKGAKRPVGSIPGTTSAFCALCQAWKPTKSTRHNAAVFIPHDLFEGEPCPLSEALPLRRHQEGAPPPPVASTLTNLNQEDAMAAPTSDDPQIIDVSPIVDEAGDGLSTVLTPAIPIAPKGGGISRDAASNEIDTQRLAGLRIGDECLPVHFEPAQASHAIRSHFGRAVESILVCGAYMERARLEMGDKFSDWFEAQKFPFKKSWAYEAMQGARAVIRNPDLIKVVKQLNRVSVYTKVAKRLGTPEGEAEFDAFGTVWGKTPADLNSLPRAELRRLAKAVEAAEKRQDEGGGDPADANEVGQLAFLPYTEVQAQRDKMAKEADDLKKELADKDRAFEEVKERLLKVENPDLNQKELEAEALEHFRKARADATIAIESLIPLRRRHTKFLGNVAVLELYTGVIGLIQKANLAAREIESIWGSELPELLMDEDGTPRSPMSRGALILARQRVQETQRTAREVGFDKSPLVFNKDGGAILFDGTEGQ